MLVGPESDGYARLRGRIPDVRVLRELTHPDEDYPYSVIQGLAEVLADIGLATGSLRRVGLAGARPHRRGPPESARDRPCQASTGSMSSPQIGGLRARKSAAEIAVIREAYRIADLGIEAAIEAIRRGVTERAVAAEIESAMRRAGAEGTGIDTIVASGSQLAADPGALHVPCHQGRRPRAADGGTACRGLPRRHRPTRARRGPWSRSSANALDVAIRAQQACAGLLRPGVEGRSVEAVGRGIVSEAGLGEAFLYSGLHSVGVIEFEPPIFGPSSPALLATDMVISIDIPMFETSWGGLRIEDGYLITESGLERLSRAPHLIQR